MNRRCLAICSSDGIWHISIAGHEMQVKPDRTVWQDGQCLAGPFETFSEALWQAEYRCRMQALRCDIEHISQLAKVLQSLCHHND